jgi:hypothetical protein
MKRRDFLTAAMLTGTAAAIPVVGETAAHSESPSNIPDGATDRHYMLDLLGRMARPVLGPMSQGRLHSLFKPELSPTWDGRDPAVAYLECFGRLISGIAPWLALPVDSSSEGRLRETLRQQALASYAHSVDPKSADYLLWRGHGQALVDSSYFTNALIRAPKALWDPLDTTTKSRIVAEIKGLRRVSPPYTNWLLFAAMNEAFLLSIGEQWDPMRVDLAIRKINEWYVGDGWYSDGPSFHFDYYDSYVIHPFLVEILEVLVANGAGSQFNALPVKELLEKAYLRMQRYGECLERMIGPDGAYPPIGRSLTYRTAVFQPLGLLAWRKRLPNKLPPAQVRSATLAAQRAVFAFDSNFDAHGHLTIGFTGHMPALGDVYSNAGSMYITSESLLALGLPSADPYWTGAGMAWTMRRAFEGESFPKDYFVNY